jgi:DNA uptake protein ComE-like DNA-binding protein
VWIVLTAAGAGFSTWAVFLYLGIRARRRLWLAWSAVYAAMMVVALVLDGPANPGDTAESVAAIMLIAAWLGGIGHVAAIRRDAARRIGRVAEGDPLLGGRDPAIAAARQRIERRAEGRRLAVKNPVLARELGVGRPDVPGADDYHLVDVNHAASSALCQLPGITPEIAARIEETRQRAGYFSSAEDLCVTMDLPPGLTDDIREHAVFL